MDRRRNRVLRRAVLAGDALLVVAAMGLAYSLHGWLLRVGVPLKESPTFKSYAALTYFTLPAWLFLLAALRLHRVFERAWSPLPVLVDLLKLHGLGFLLLTAGLFLLQGTINRTIVFSFLGASFVLMFFERAVLARWARYLYRDGQSQERILLVGDFTPELEAWSLAVAGGDFSPHIVGIVGSEAPGASKPKYMGTLSDLGRILHHEAIDSIFFFPPYNHTHEIRDAIRVCDAAGVMTAFALDSIYRYPVKPDVLSLGDRAFTTFESVAHRPGALAVKHTLDVVAAALGLIIALPVLIAIALAVRVTMGPPVLLVQERMGSHGRRFKMLKFRTMCRDAEVQRADLWNRNEMSGPVFKVSADPRVTPLGRFLRRWSLDELPQLINVLAGSMSLVGPRPLPIVEQQGIEGWYRRRLSMKPGLTGLWQVSGRSDVDFDEWMRLDLAYVDSWSLKLDIIIFLKTVPAVLRGRGAR